ncbi:MAG: SCO family protein [Flavobacteriales bacterium]|nr:SCO family protein [Flavobacteriales bacterium]MCB9193408.1 SCO family protein [Flavobacteriales bacterium]
MMKPSGRGVKIAVLGGIALFILLIFLFFSPALGLVKHHFTFLPYYGPKTANAPGDTTYFTVPPFAFTDENGHTVTDKTVAGRILVVDFFFTRCTTICPRMGAEMQQLQLKLDDPAYADVLFLSHTVDPEHDTAEVLNEYAQRLKADTTRWMFLTGTKHDLYLQGADGYFLASREDVMAPDGFLHSEMFVLVDKQRHIRGYYDGTKTADVDRLAGDIKMLLKEEKIKAKERRS